MLYERTKLSNRSEEQVISLFKTDSRLEPDLILQNLRYVIANMLKTLTTKLCFYSASLYNIL